MSLYSFIVHIFILVCLKVRLVKQRLADAILAQTHKHLVEYIINYHVESKFKM